MAFYQTNVGGGGGEPMVIYLTSSVNGGATASNYFSTILNKQKVTIEANAYGQSANGLIQYKLSQSGSYITIASNGRVELTNVEYISVAVSKTNPAGTIPMATITIEF